ncbi:hypothetical protein ACFU99_08660 [Streptomyces sp. NPDC057654]|uniref:hypothetical protein n=1 Tax=Streptomyces sp. NPDC057654 TaxID=3346196 RepID=UPI0036996FF0
MAKYEATAETIWSTTHSNMNLWHAFGPDGKALCNRRIHPRSHTTTNDNWRTRAEAENFGTLHDRCVKKLEQHAEADRLAAASPLAAAAALLAKTVVQADTEQAVATAELLAKLDEQGAGTWRGEWIGALPADAALFDLTPVGAEQGALFT